MLTLCLMLSVIYYVNNYAGIIGWSLKVISIVASHSYILYPKIKCSCLQLFYGDSNPVVLKRNIFVMKYVHNMPHFMYPTEQLAT